MDNAAHSFGETSYPGINLQQEYKEDILVGYRWHDTKNIDPAYPFGFGLSYTNFKFSDIESDKNEYSKNDEIIIRSKVANSGDLYGAEVVQVYIGKENSKVQRALKELKGFQKVYLKKGEEQEVSITIDVNKLAFYNEDIANWEIETGDYFVYVGNSSKDISKKIRIRIN
jgi:beta-glucosidase